MKGKKRKKRNATWHRKAFHKYKISSVSVWWCLLSKLQLENPTRGLPKRGQNMNTDFKHAVLAKWTRVRGQKHPLSPRDAQSDVRSLPRTARGWKMRQQRPDIKGRPSAGVNVQKKLAKVIKTHLWTQASAASHTVSYYWHPVAAINQHGERIRSAQPPHAQEHSRWETPQRCQKNEHVNINFLLADGKWD